MKRALIALAMVVSLAIGTSVTGLSVTASGPQLSAHGALAAATAAPVAACKVTATGQDPSGTPDKNGNCPVDPFAASSAGPVCVAVPVVTSTPQGRCPSGQVEITSTYPGGPIVAYVVMVLKLINILLGGIIILVIVIAGIQYIVSAGDPSRVKSAKKRITQAFTALVLYLLMFAILNFLVPGGVLV